MLSMRNKEGSILAPIALMIAVFTVVESCRLASGCSGIARAEPNCNSMLDADDRNYCRALSTRQKRYCEYIKREALREECRALIKE